MARKTSKTKTPDELDCTKALQESLEHLLNEARQIRAMVEKLEARDDARELRRLVRRMKPQPWEAEDRFLRQKPSSRLN